MTTDEERLRVHQMAVRAHNERMMEEAGVPTGGHSPRRGFYRATGYGLDYILRIEKHKRSVRTRKGEEYFWSVLVNFSPKSNPMTDHHFIIGPRGKTTRSY